MRIMKKIKIRKRLLTVFLGAMLAIGCTACGNKAEEQHGEPVGNEAPEASTEYPGLRDLGEMLAEAEGVDYDEVAGNQSGYKKGKLTDFDYVSDYVGIHFTLPQGYKMDVDNMNFFNEMTESILSGEFGLSGQFGLDEVLGDEEIAFRCEMMAANTEGKNAAAVIFCMEMNMADENGNYDEGMAEENWKGFDKVSMWGQEWMHMTMEKAKEQRPSSYEGEGDAYCRVYPDALYMVAVLYDDNSAKEKDVLLSAFEETVQGKDTAAE